jgi:hypothetical protein
VKRSARTACWAHIAGSGASRSGRGTRVVSIDYIGQGQAIDESTVSERLLNIAVAGLWTPFPTGVP